MIFALFTLGDLFRSLQLKVTVGMDLVLVSLFAGFLYWYCQIALETLQKKLLAQYTS